jgi:hypothetical protein
VYELVIDTRQVDLVRTQYKQYKNLGLSVISGFRRDADEICALLGYKAASRGNFLPTFRDNVSVPSSRVKNSKTPRFLDILTLDDGTDTLSRNVGKGLPLDAALYPRRAQMLRWVHLQHTAKVKLSMCRSLRRSGE